MTPNLRTAVASDEPFLWEMLYEASHAADDGVASADRLRKIPELARYLEGWGRPGDAGVVGAAADGGEASGGAAWVRLFTAEAPAYGYVADDLPELAIGVAPGMRGAGLGTAILRQLIADIRPQFPGMSLSVRRDNPARRLYERLGFVAVDGSAVTNRVGQLSLTMVLRWDGSA